MQGLYEITLKDFEKARFNGKNPVSRYWEIYKNNRICDTRGLQSIDDFCKIELMPWVPNNEKEPLKEKIKEIYKAVLSSLRRIHGPSGHQDNELHLCYSTIASNVESFEAILRGEKVLFHEYHMSMMDCYRVYTDHKVEIDFILSQYRSESTKYCELKTIQDFMMPTEREEIERNAISAVLNKVSKSPALTDGLIITRNDVAVWLAGSS